MAELRAWIRAQRESGYGTLHLFRALALSEAAVREGIEHVTVLTDSDGADFLRDLLPEGVNLETVSTALTPEQESGQLIENIKPYIPARFDSRHPRPLVYLLGHRWDAAFQRRLWKAGIEVVVVADEGHPTFADYYVIPKPYASELGIESVSGYTRFLRGGHHAPLPERAMKAIFQSSDHRTFAQNFSVATENLDIDKWLPVIGKALSMLEPPPDSEQTFEPTLTILPGVDCPSDEELRQKAGNPGNLKVTVAQGRRDHTKELVDTDVLFAPDGILLQEALAIGTVRVVLPRKGVKNTDLMYDHLIRREASVAMPSEDSGDYDTTLQALMRRVSFDPSYRRGQNRIGQWLCDGMGSIRIIRQTAFKIYTVPQNVIRFFEMGDPTIKKM